MVHRGRRGRRWLARLWADHPRIALGVRAAVAAAIAWWLAHLLPGPAAEFPYYAPLGAVIATTLTLAGSVRESLQAVTAIAIGSGIAFAADQVAPEEDPLTVAAVIALGVLAGGWRKLGGMGAWTPMAALFTLVIGGGEAFYVGAYTGLVLLGAAVGVVVNAAFPPLPMAPLRAAISEVRATVAGQLADLAEALEAEEPLDAEEWEHRQRDLAPQRSTLREALATAREARRGNRRARRYAQDLDELARQAQALDRLALHVADLTDLLAGNERADLEELALGPALRPRTAEVLRSLESMLGPNEEGESEDETSDEANRTREALEELVEEVDRARSADRRGGGMLVASAVVVTTRRALDELAAVRQLHVHRYREEGTPRFESAHQESERLARDDPQT